MRLGHLRGLLEGQDGDLEVVTERHHVSGAGIVEYLDGSLAFELHDFSSIGQPLCVECGTQFELYPHIPPALICPWCLEKSRGGGK